MITYKDNIFYRVQGEDNRRTLATSFMDFWRNVKNYNFVPNKKIGYDVLFAIFIIFFSME